MAEHATPSETRTVFVTGAGGGIGSGIVHALHRRGHRLICTDLQLSAMEALERELGDRLHLVAMDVTRQESIEDAVAALPAGIRDIDILIHCAGHDIGGRRPFHEGTAEQWASILDTNLTGTVRVTRAVLPRMLERGVGHMIFLGSTAGVQIYPHGSAYIASKAGIHAFVQTLRLDYQETDLRFTELQPGPVVTGFSRRRFLDDAAKGQAYYDNLRGVLAVEHVVHCALFAIDMPEDANLAHILLTPTREGHSDR